jgi:hypothetical protein
MRCACAARRWSGEERVTRARSALPAPRKQLLERAEAFASGAVAVNVFLPQLDAQVGRAEASCLLSARSAREQGAAGHKPREVRVSLETEDAIEALLRMCARRCRRAAGHAWLRSSLALSCELHYAQGDFATALRALAVALLHPRASSSTLCVARALPASRHAAPCRAAV